MTREEYEAISFEDFMEWARENIQEITDEETLKDYAMDKLYKDDFGMVLHIIKSVYENPYDTEWYRYDYSMGILQTPSPITKKEDIEDLIPFMLTDLEPTDPEYDYDGKEILCPDCGSKIVIEFGDARCDVCGWFCGDGELDDLMEV